jgi:hypothetical protein
MKKYIVSVQKTSTDLLNQSDSKKDIASEIISHFCCEKHGTAQLSAFEADSKFATLALLDKSAIASLEIDDITEKQWKNEISKMYKREQAIRKAIDSSFHNIMSAAIAFEQVCYESTIFHEVEICDDLDLANAFDGIGTSAHFQISEIVRSIYKVNFL